MFQKSKEASTVNPEGGGWEAEVDTHGEHLTLLLWVQSTSRNQATIPIQSHFYPALWPHFFPGEKLGKSRVLHVGVGLIQTTCRCGADAPLHLGEQSSYLYLHRKTTLSLLASLLCKGRIWVRLCMKQDDKETLAHVQEKRLFLITRCQSTLFCQMTPKRTTLCSTGLNHQWEPTDNILEAADFSSASAPKRVLGRLVYKQHKVPFRLSFTLTDLPINKSFSKANFPISNSAAISH